MNKTIDQSVQFVNEQIEFHAHRAKQYMGTYRAEKHMKTHDKLVALRDIISQKSTDQGHDG